MWVLLYIVFFLYNKLYSEIQKKLYFNMDVFYNLLISMVDVFLNSFFLLSEFIATMWSWKYKSPFPY